MFASGDAVLPSQGMGAIAQQLAERLPPGTVCTNSVVARLEEHGVRLADGCQLSGKAIVVATESPAAASLLGEPQPPAGRSVTCLYFAAERPPVDEPILVLNGEGLGIVNNLCVPSLVGSTYAPPGAALVSATVLGIPAIDGHHLESSVRQQLQEWFGNQVQTWRHLRTYHIPFALPTQSPPALSPVAKPSGKRPLAHRGRGQGEGAWGAGARTQHVTAFRLIRTGPPDIVVVAAHVYQLRLSSCRNRLRHAFPTRNPRTAIRQSRSGIPLQRSLVSDRICHSTAGVLQCPT